MTRGLTGVGSAAAVILSLGDRREARRNARLHYHGVRISEQQSLTAEVAAYQAGWMGRVDAAVLSDLAARALEAPAREFAADGITVEDRLAAARLARGVDWPGRDAPETDGPGDAALARLRALVAWCAEGPRGRFAALYAGLLRLDQTISAALALALRLIDGIADGRGGGAPERPKDAFRVPQWSALFPSGEVARDALCRHVLVLGEPGSGKTASAILPAVAAACDPGNRVGCALLIDPKREIRDAVADLAGADLRVFEPGRRDGVRQIIDVMASPEWSLEADLAAGRARTAARKILLRSASLAPASPAQTLNGTPAKGRDPYWEVEGAKLALTAVATTLALFRDERPAPAVDDAVHRDFARELAGFRRLAGLAADGGDGRAGPNVLALAQFFGPDRCPTFGALLVRRFEAADSEIRTLADDVRQWRQLAAHSKGPHFMGVHSMARQAFADFAAETPARTLYFGCEPGLKAALAGGGAASVAFDRSVDATDGRAVHLYQPSLGAAHDILIAKALKAAYFEAILGSERRSLAGHGMPLAAYVADEAHRFVTCDAAHGEQSFMDACRSFGAFCVLATQSCSSLRHALGEFGHGGEHAVEMLLANTATKLFFRSTDGTAQRHVRDLCPRSHGQRPDRKLGIANFRCFRRCARTAAGPCSSRSQRRRTKGTCATRSPSTTTGRRVRAVERLAFLDLEGARQLYAHAGEALGNESLGDARLERVEALDLAGFDGERPTALLQPLVEEGARFVAVFQPGADRRPLVPELGVAGHQPAVSAIGHARKRAPDLGWLLVGEVHGDPPRAACAAVLASTARTEELYA